MAFIDYNTLLYKIVGHQLNYMQLYNTQHALHYEKLEKLVYRKVICYRDF